MRWSVDAGLRLSDAEATFLNGAWMPSIAEELATDWNMARLRTAGSRKYGLVSESLRLMDEWYQTRVFKACR